MQIIMPKLGVWEEKKFLNTTDWNTSKFSDFWEDEMSILTSLQWKVKWMQKENTFNNLQFNNLWMPLSPVTPDNGI